VDEGDNMDAAEAHHGHENGNNNEKVKIKAMSKEPLTDNVVVSDNLLRRVFREWFYLFLRWIRNNRGFDVLPLLQSRS